MDHAQSQEGISKTLGEISSALLRLSDALVELSLRLQDLRFEIDQAQRAEAQAEFLAVFEKMHARRSGGESRGTPHPGPGAPDS